MSGPVPLWSHLLLPPPHNSLCLNYSNLLLFLKEAGTPLPQGLCTCQLPLPEELSLLVSPGFALPWPSGSCWKVSLWGFSWPFFVRLQLILPSLAFLSHCIFLISCIYFCSLVIAFLPLFPSPLDYGLCEGWSFVYFVNWVSPDT